MPDTIFEQGEAYTIYFADEWGPAVPYPPVVHKDGQVNHGFIELRGNQDTSTNIPEARGKPGLISLLNRINAADSPFMTLGCESGVFYLPPEEVSPTRPTCYIGSYVDVAFRDCGCAYQSAALALARSIVTERKLSPPDWARLELGIQRLKDFFGASGCYSVELKISAYGRLDAGAWKNFNYQCSRMTEVFDRLVVEFETTGVGSP